MEMIVQGINYIIPIALFGAGVFFRELVRLIHWLLKKLEITERDLMPGYQEHKDVFKDGGK